MEILSTKNYKQFKTIKGNRPIHPSHVNNLIRSLARKNLLAENPIMVNSRLEIIDGQHRLEAAKRSDLEIYYFISDKSPEESFNDMLVLNSFTRAWIATDFLESYVELGYPEYIKIKEYYEDNKPLSLIVILMLAKKATHSDKTFGLRREFKEGGFRIADQEFLDDMSALLKEVMPFLATAVWNHKEFLYALMKLYAEGNGDKLIVKLNSSGKKIFKRVTQKEYRRDFEDILALKGSYNKDD